MLQIGDTVPDFAVQTTAGDSAQRPGSPSARCNRDRGARKMDTELLVIGAGPYGLSTAALAQERGIETVIVGRPMGFWRANMPKKMFLRSGPDWHLDASGVDTLEA
jgi:precorrin isomerase